MGKKRRRAMTYEKIVGYVQKKFDKVDVSNAESVAVQIDVTGEGEGAFYVAIKEGKLEVAPYEYYDHDAKVVVDSADLIAIVDGKLDAGVAFNEGKIRVEGNVDKFMVIKGLLAAKAAKAAAPKAPKKASAPKAAKKAPAEKKEAPKATEKKAETKKTEAKKTEVKKAEVKKPAAKTAKKK